MGNYAKEPHRGDCAQRANLDRQYALRRDPGHRRDTVSTDGSSCNRRFVWHPRRQVTRLGGERIGNEVQHPRHPGALRVVDFEEKAVRNYPVGLRGKHPHHRPRQL